MLRHARDWCSLQPFGDEHPWSRHDDLRNNDVGIVGVRDCEPSLRGCLVLVVQFLDEDARRSDQQRHGEGRATMAASRDIADTVLRSAPMASRMPGY